MKVLKFGGTSVGSVNSILSLKRIVEKEAKRGPVIVVVSALGGITDKLLLTARMARQGDTAFREEFDKMVDRHHLMIDTVITDAAKRDALTAEIDALFGQLSSIYQGVYLIHDLSAKTQDTIVSYGEQLSSRIVAALVEGAQWHDSRDFIKTEVKGGKDVLASELTEALVRERFATLPQVSLIPGFISRDKDTGETTTLGRGGSDYTAAIVAAALNADALEIWTDVNGFMTADPRLIPNAYTIPELTYLEATELCNFGAKVIYPPTIYPVCVNDIPIWVKNTFNPNFPGTVIKRDIARDNKPIKGISSISSTAIINVTGLAMVGVIGVNHRIFSSLAQRGISVFMVCQTASENSTSIGVKDSDADEAERVLNHEFAKEIEKGSMNKMIVERGLSTIAIVGENMRHTPGVAAKLYGSLARSGISVIASSQGASETNISCVIESQWTRKALNVIHDSFFLSEYNMLNLFVIGTGTVGSKLIEQIRSQYSVLKSTRRLKLNVVGIANSRHALFDADGIDLDNYRAELDRCPRYSGRQLLDEILRLNLFNSVCVDCTASAEISDLYHELLDHNVAVVAANKIAASGPYDSYMALKRMALARGVKYRFETNVGAGLPLISTINDLIDSGDKITRIEAVLSGTLNYMFNELSPSSPFSATLRRAMESGLTEPDPRTDLSGIDVVRKLVILAREAGYKIEPSQVECQRLLPAEMYEGSLDQFLEALPQLDAEWEQRRQELEAQGLRWRFVATMERGKAWVGLQAVGPEHPFYNLEASNNIVLLTTDRYQLYPMQIKGYGAGASVAAAGVFADIMNIANI